MGQKSETEVLRLSSQRLGRLYPILVDKHGNIIDGKHRFKADRNWPTVVIEDISSEEERLRARLVTNVCRRVVSAREKRDILSKLGSIYLRKGVNVQQLALKISEETGMSYRWVMDYLPQDLKYRPGIGGPKTYAELDKTTEKLDKGKVAGLATEILREPESEGHRKFIFLKNYANTNFVTLMMEKSFYERYRKIAGYLGMEPETAIERGLSLLIEHLEGKRASYIFGHACQSS